MTSPDPIPLEPSAEQMRVLGDAALDEVIAFIEGLNERSAAGGLDGDGPIPDSLGAPPPELGRPIEAVFADVREAAARSLEPAGPGYLAYIPGGGLYSAAIASFVANGLNRFVNIATTAPDLVRIEADVIRWLCDLFRLPAGSGGILTSGGSLANLSALVTARAASMPDDPVGGTIYVSDQAHASIAKAAKILGFPPDAVAVVPSDAAQRIDAAALAVRMRDDRTNGRRPLCVVANAGTTNTGSVDPIEAIADLCAREELWLHVDAAYGGFFQLTERGAGRFTGIERADSITLDPHKGMFLPYGTGSLVVRDAARLRAAHAAGGAEYLQDLIAGDEVLPSFTEYSPELSRDFRGLRVWLPLQLHGVAAFRSALDEKLDLAERLYTVLADDDALEVIGPPDLSIVGFRLAEPVGDPAEANRRFLERINASGRVFCSSTVLEGAFTLRAAILSVRTHADRIEDAIRAIRDAAHAR